MRSPDPEKEFVDLLVAHQPLINAFIVSLMPGQSDADDVIQDTNQVLWEKRGDFELGTNFKAWVLTIARFQVMARHKRVKISKNIPLDEDVQNLICEEFEELEVNDMGQKIRSLNHCLGRLKPRDQELVLNRYWEKTSLKDYARSTGHSVSALKSMLFRIRTQLRVCIERTLVSQP